MLTLRLNVLYITSFHPETHKSKPGLVCLACSEAKFGGKRLFTTIRELFDHTQLLHPTLYQPFRCAYCRFGTKSKQEWINHKLTKHG